MSVSRSIWHAPRNISKFIIRVYQRTLSFDHGPLRKLFPYGYCKFHPSCSEYGRQAIAKYGFVGGWARAVWRVLRCNPCAHGGIDNP